MVGWEEIAGEGAPARCPGTIKSTLNYLFALLQEGPQKPELALEVRGITKRYGNLLADDHIDFELKRGEIHALLGENGAGKTTFCNVLYGFVRPDSGEIYRKGESVRFSSPK